MTDGKIFLLEAASCYTTAGPSHSTLRDSSWLSCSGNFVSSHFVLHSSWLQPLRATQQLARSHIVFACCIHLCTSSCQSRMQPHSTSYQTQLQIKHNNGHSGIISLIFTTRTASLACSLTLVLPPITHSSIPPNNKNLLFELPSLFSHEPTTSRTTVVCRLFLASQQVHNHSLILPKRSDDIQKST